jgi:3-hydroxyacyl-[acyl-carrier-protein] dehydratase
MTKEVETLIPHRSPFLFVDRIISLTKDEIIGETIFHGTNGFLTGSFPEFNYVPGVILMEALAQCGGAGIKKLGLADGLFGFANIEAANFYEGVEYDTLFRMVIKNIKVTEKYIKQTGRGIVGTHTCMDLSWICVRFQ